MAGATRLAPALVLAMPALAALAPAGMAAEPGPLRAPVTTEAALRQAWADPMRRRVDLGADLVLRDCRSGDPIRESPFPLLLHGHGHTLRQTCFEQRVLRQDGTGYLELRDVTLTRGGADGPGAALATRGELLFVGGAVTKNLAEEPGGGLFSMRGITVRGAHINGNLANDDGGGVYARRGGVEIHDSVLSNNLVDGSGGAVGSTGDILVVRSQVDGNTTDGDGGALYADEDGDVTVIGSLIDGSTADGPGGAIFTLDGDIAVLDSSLIGNRADDRGGAVAGEADVLVVNSTVARNLAVAHAGGGVWARGELVLINATVTDNYAEGEGGGALAAGRATVLGSTVTQNIASVAANLGSAGTLRAFGSIIGPAMVEETTGDTRPTRRSCRVYAAESSGYNFVTDGSCELAHATDITGSDPKLRRLEDDPKGFVLTPFDGSPVRARIPPDRCVLALPAPLPAGQLLDRFADWDAVRTRDATGAVRGAWRSLRHRRRPIAAAAGRAPARADGDGDARPRRHRFGLAGGAPAGRGGARGPGEADAGGRRAAPAAGPEPAGARPPQSPRRPAARVHHGGARRPGGRSPPPLGLQLRRARRHRSLQPDGAGPGTRRRGAAAAPPPPRAHVPLPQRRTGSGRVRARRGRRGVAAGGARTRRRTRRAAGGALRRLGVLPDLAADHRVRRCRTSASGSGAAADTTPPSTSTRRNGTTRTTSWPRSSAATAPGRPGVRHRARRGRVPAAGAARLRRGRRAGPDRPPPGAGARPPEPVGEITRFDECLYTVGVRVRHGYDYARRRGGRVRRAAFAFDLHGHEPAELDLLAFPAEEPPEIECNEDAGDEDAEE